MSNDFDWNKGDGVVLKPRSGVAVYPNAPGNIVIRVQCAPGDDEFIVLTIEEAESVVKGLEATIREIGTRPGFKSR